MKKPFALLLFAVISFVSCEEKETNVSSEPATQAVEDKTLKERLPRENRKAFLDPIESSYDAISSLADDNIMLSKDTTEIRIGEASGFAIVYSDERNVAKKELFLSNESVKEKHAWYYDNEQHVIKSTHVFKGLTFSADGSTVDQKIQFYYEDDGVMLSSYQKLAMEGRSFPEKWRQHTFDPQQLSLVWGRMTVVNEL